MIPLDDRVLVQLDDEKTVTPGGLVLPDSAREKASTGKVVATGPGRLNLKDGTRMEMCIATDDRVLFEKMLGTELRLDGVKYALLRSADVYCILTEGNR